MLERLSGNLTVEETTLEGEWAVIKVTGSVGVNECVKLKEG